VFGRAPGLHCGAPGMRSDHHRTDHASRSTAAVDVLKFMVATLAVAVVIDLGAAAVATRLSIVLAGIAVATAVIAVPALIATIARHDRSERLDRSTVSEGGESTAHLSSDRLFALCQRVSSSRGVRRTARLTAEAALELVPADIVHVWIGDDRARRLRIAAFRSRLTGGQTLPPRTELGWGTGLAGWVVEHRAQRYAADLLDGPLHDVDEWMTAAGFGAAMATPLIVDAVPVGALVLIARDSAPFTARNVERLAVFARSAASALDHALVHARASRRAARLTALVRATRMLGSLSSPTDIPRAVARVFRRVFGARLAVVWIADDHASALRARGVAGVRTDRIAPSVPLVNGGSDVLGAVFATETPEYGSGRPSSGGRGRHHDHDPVAGWAAIPLVASDGAVGVLSLRFAERRVLDDDERELARLLAREATMALARRSTRSDRHEFAVRSRAAATHHHSAARGAADVVHVG
jgi:GAF domain-containing protein